MSDITYINIHRHGPAQQGEWAIENIYKNFENMPSHSFSAGIHPWYIHNDWQILIYQLAQASANKNFLAVGECGLDKLKTSEGNIGQEAVFTAQVKLANEINKPLIIHSVKSYDDILHILKLNKNKVPVIFHGFNSSYEMAADIIKKGYYLSFGKEVKKGKISNYLPQLPLSNIFLETDDEAISIQEIYQATAQIKNISIEELSLQLQQNLQRVFNIAL